MVEVRRVRRFYIRHTAQTRGGTYLCLVSLGGNGLWRVALLTVDTCCLYVEGMALRTYFVAEIICMPVGHHCGYYVGGHSGVL
jgi:hypothetical protein